MATNLSFTLVYEPANNTNAMLGLNRAFGLRFTAPAAGATRLGFRLQLWDADDHTWNNGNFNESFYAFLNQSATSHAGGTAVKVDRLYSWDPFIAEAEIAANLLPGTAYTLWFFAGAVDKSYGYSSASVWADGVYGVKSSPSASDGWFEEGLSVTLRQTLSGTVHTVTVSCAGQSETLLDRSPSLTARWRPDVAAYARLLPNAGSAPVTVSCETFYNGASFGSLSCTATLRFRGDSLRPGLAEGWYALSPENTGAAAPLSGYIQGYSAVRAVFDPDKVQCREGATVRSFALALREGRAEAAPYVTPTVLTGRETVTLTVTDSRGLTASETVTLTPLDTFTPTLRAGSAWAWRSDASGTAREDGSCLCLLPDVAYPSLDGQNALTLTVRTSPAGGSYGDPIALTQGQQTVLTGYSADRSWDVELTVRDRLGAGITAAVRIPTQGWAIKCNAAGTAVAFGKAPEADKVLEIPADWSIRKDGRNYLLDAYPVGAVYLSLSSVSPAELFGGTWEQITGRFLLAAGETYAAGDTGGEAAHTLTAAELPAHQHSLGATKTAAAGSAQWRPVTYGEAGSTAVSTQSVGGGAAHNNMPPYLAVYMWKRTA